MVSKHDHCFNDLLYRYHTVALNIEIPAIISNHPDLEELAEKGRDIECLTLSRAVRGRVKF